MENLARLPEPRVAKRPLRRAAVLGAGVMGAQIAAHLANAAIPVTLFELAGDGDDRSAPARDAIKRLAKLKPAPLGTAGVEARIVPANYDDDLAQLAECDLVIEAVAERLDIKASLYESLAPHVADEAILASNTSGLSINALADVLPASIRGRFLGIHFFNPPRYMHLVELIPSRHTDAGIVERLEPLLVSALGKGVVIARDTPNFIGNRIGVFSLVATMHHAVELGIGFEVVDQITGKPLGRPKSGTFRTADVVGLDTLGHVINTLRDNLDKDPWHRYYEVPAYIEALIAAGALGQKTRKGLYADKGKRVFDPAAGDYVAADRGLDDELQAIFAERDWGRKLAALRSSDNVQARFTWRVLCDVFHYAIVTLAEIAETARDVDFAMRWGFGWKLGPFEIMQQAGWSDVVAAVAADIEAGLTLADAPLPAWASSIDAVHTPAGSYAPASGDYRGLRDNPVYDRQAPRENVVGSMAAEQAGSTVFENDAVRLWHEDDGIAVLSFKTKMRAVSTEVLDGIIEACAEAERGFDGLVLWHPGAPFSVGADLKQAGELAARHGIDTVRDMIAKFQQASMSLKHCLVPTVAAVDGMALGGGCEFQMHCNRTVASLESYIGLVEVGVGLLPAGGGLKELAIRSANFARGGELMPHIGKAFELAAMGTTATSGLDAQRLGLLVDEDVVIANGRELLHVARHQARAMAASNFRPPDPQALVPVAGNTGRASLMMIAVNMLEGGFISEHDYEIAGRIASVLCGGDVDPGTSVSQGWLLKLELDNFVELMTMPKTQERIEHTLKTGKPLRN